MALSPSSFSVSGAAQVRFWLNEEGSVVFEESRWGAGPASLNSIHMTHEAGAMRVFRAGDGDQVLLPAHTPRDEPCAPGGLGARKQVSGRRRRSLLHHQ